MTPLQLSVIDCSNPFWIFSIVLGKVECALNRGEVFPQHPSHVLKVLCDKALSVEVTEVGWGGVGEHELERDAGGEAKFLDQATDPALQKGRERDVVL